MDESFFEVAVDGCRITQIESLDVALACLMGCYWIFDIQYPKCLKCTLSFMSSQVLKLPGESAEFPMKLHRFLNLIPKIL